ncbi:hypothetical protein N9A94_05080 [Akkermansiaceae bacterium]|jgi:Tfp pilus assembly protein PilO|nr:hypothetical protein [Akkermansiaceae bacterium]MDA7888829.1 hypothetical protein [Akkermansiaceae bacterium]MDB4537128.1 hypothetical protein [Akkermansiaceae bacterium]
MTSREKNLLILLCSALFLILNVVAFKKFYSPEIAKANGKVVALDRKYQRAEGDLQMKDAWQKSMNWLENSEGKPITYPEAEAKLQSFMRKQADARGLTTREEKILPHVQGPYYTRVRVSYKLTGMEQQVQQWIMSVHQPRQFQVITKMTMKPQTNDLTRIDIEVEVEKFIILADPNNPV